MTATVTPIGDLARVVGYTTATAAQLAEFEVAHALATVTPWFGPGDGASARLCKDCHRTGHRPS